MRSVAERGTIRSIMREPHSVRVLVVDDDASVRRGFTRLLRAFDVVAVDTAQAALRRLAEHPADVILTDFGMSPTDGVSLLRDVAASYPKIRRFLMSGFEPAHFAAHLASGLIHRVFTKPVDVPTLLEALLGVPPGNA